MTKVAIKRFQPSFSPSSLDEFILECYQRSFAGVARWRQIFMKPIKRQHDSQKVEWPQVDRLQLSCTSVVFEKKTPGKRRQAFVHRFVKKSNEYSRLVLDGKFLSNVPFFVLKHQQIHAVGQVAAVEFELVFTIKNLHLSGFNHISE